MPKRLQYWIKSLLLIRKEQIWTLIPMRILQVDDCKNGTTITLNFVFLKNITNALNLEKIWFWYSICFKLFSSFTKNCKNFVFSLNWLKRHSLHCPGTYCMWTDSSLCFSTEHTNVQLVSHPTLILPHLCKKIWWKLEYQIHTRISYIKSCTVFLSHTSL